MKIIVNTERDRTSSIKEVVAVLLEPTELIDEYVLRDLALLFDSPTALVNTRIEAATKLAEYFKQFASDLRRGHGHDRGSVYGKGSH